MSKVGVLLMKMLYDAVKKHLIAGIVIAVMFAVPFGVHFLGMAIPVEVLGVCLLISICCTALCWFLNWTAALVLAALLVGKAGWQWDIGVLPFFLLLLYTLVVFVVAKLAQKAWDNRETND